MSTPTGNNGYLTDVDVRQYLLDNVPEANLLIDALESTPEAIRSAMTFTVDAWNEMSPILRSYDMYNFPWRHALLKGTCGHLLISLSHRFRRNKLSFAVPGGGISDQDRDQAYLDEGQRLWTEFIDWARLNKRSLNVALGWGSI